MPIYDIIKRLIAGILALCLIFSVASNSAMNLWYEIGNKSFEKAFCINIDKPSKGCHGSCKMKKINKAPEEKEDFNTSFFLPQLELSQFILSLKKVNSSMPLIFTSNHPSFYQTPDDSGFKLAIYHPPESTFLPYS